MKVDYQLLLDLRLAQNTGGGQDIGLLMIALNKRGAFEADFSAEKFYLSRPEKEDYILLFCCERYPECVEQFKKQFASLPEEEQEAFRKQSQVIFFSSQEDLRERFWSIYVHYSPGRYSSSENSKENSKHEANTLALYSNRADQVGALLVKPYLSGNQKIHSASVTDISPKYLYDIRDMVAINPACLSELTKSRFMFIKERKEAQKILEGWKNSLNESPSQIKQEGSILSLDLERDGLYGAYVSVGAVVFNMAAVGSDQKIAPAVTELFYAWVDLKKSQFDFVNTDVIPKLDPTATNASPLLRDLGLEEAEGWLSELKKRYNFTENQLYQVSRSQACADEQALIDAFLDFYAKHETCSKILAETPFPVEQEFLERCCARIAETKGTDAVSLAGKLLDLNSLVEARQIPSDQRVSRICVHNSLADALMSCEDYIRVLQERVYSYHSYVFPFRLGMSDANEWFAKSFTKDASRLNKFIKALNNSGSAWEPLSELFPAEDEEGSRLNYASYQYFNPEARAAVWGQLGGGSFEDSPIVREWHYMPTKLRNKAKYLIAKATKEEKEKEGQSVLVAQESDFTLLLNAIRLKVYNTGVILLIFECENRLYSSMSSIESINDIGRRIKAAFIYTKGGFHPVSPSSLAVYLPKKTKDNDTNTDTAGVRIPQEEEDYNFGGKVHDAVSCEGGLTAIPKVARLLFEDVLKRYENKLKLIDTVDDRMFVSALIRHDRFSELLKTDNASRSTTGETALCDTLSHYQYKEEISEQLYRLVFNDHGFATCPNRAEKAKLIDKHLYPRWSTCGTVHAASHNSMLCVCSSQAGLVVDAVVNPFLTMYFEICLLVLAQRVSLLGLSAQAGRLSGGLQESGLQLGEKDKIDDFLALQERYIAFKNQLLIFEVTSQEQGVELYRLLRESLYIMEEKEELDSQLDSLYEVVNVTQDHSFSKLANRFAGFALVLAILAILYDRVDNLLNKPESDSFSTWIRTSLSGRYYYYVFALIFLLGLFFFVFSRFNCFTRPFTWFRKTLIEIGKRIKTMGRK